MPPYGPHLGRPLSSAGQITPCDDPLLSQAASGHFYHNHGDSPHHQAQIDDFQPEADDPLDQPGQGRLVG